MNIGLVGCGNISDTYFQNLTNLFAGLSVYACSDLSREKVTAAAEKYGIEHIMSFEEMITCDKIDLILILTPPKAHYPLAREALMKGKHVYMEKPLSLTYAQGKELLALSREKGLYLGCAPDTFMGAGIQTCIRLVEDGRIGTPFAATAFMMYPGPERWHPDPGFFYEVGGGALYDMGPYYLTALVRLLGKAESVMAYSVRPIPQRVIGSGEKKGQKVDVQIDTHVTGLIRFESGAVATLAMSFDVIQHSMPNLEIYGTEGSIKVPDPNCFGGPVLLATQEDPQFRECPLVSPYTEESRGLGLADTVLALREHRQNNASGALALHVLEIMEGLTRSAQEGKQIRIESTPSAPVPLDWNAPVGCLKTHI